MKIISKYKDYYDYLSGVWGEDPKLVLDRRSSESFSTSDGKVILIIAGYKVEGYKNNGKYYFGEDLKQFANVENSKWDNVTYPHITIAEYNHYGKRMYSGRDDCFALEPVPGFDHLNKQYDCPIIIKYWNGSYKKYPKLDELNVAGFVPAETIYQWLSQWLAREVDKLQERPDNLTNNQKIESKGFDKTTSFRPNIKK